MTITKVPLFTRSVITNTNRVSEILRTDHGRWNTILNILVSSEGASHAAAILSGTVIRVQTREPLDAFPHFDNDASFKDVKQIGSAVGTGGETWSFNGTNSSLSFFLIISGAWDIRVGCPVATEFATGQPNITVTIQGNNTSF